MKVFLQERFFTDKETTFLECGEFKASLFTYSTGIKAVRLSNAKGGIVVLPWMGQMVWRAEFQGHELTMKSIYDEPQVCGHFGESYGCFLMHCGLTAMGNPTAEDTHVGHAELPIIRYKEAYLEFGKDKSGEYVAVGGTAFYDMCFTYNYSFSPRVVLRKGAAKIEIAATVKNLKDLPFEYYYLCHVNHRPVNGSKIVESPLKRPPIINHEVPADYYKPWADATNAWLAVLDKDYKAQSVVGAKGESYRPEIVNCYFHKADKAGWAVVKQVYPKGGGVFVKYRPSELPYATRWIARTKDEDAMGMCLPATCEHKGRLFCQAHKEQRYLAPGKTVSFHIEPGLL